jgi:hypothetical protein
MATRPKGRTRLQMQDYPGEGVAEFVQGNGSRPGLWVIEIHPAVSKSLNDKEVVKVPKDNIGTLQASDSL